VRALAELTDVTLHGLRHAFASVGGIDDYARTRHMSRSGFLAQAAENALRLE